MYTFSTYIVTDNSQPGTMAEGMTFTIEPIFSQGSEETVVLDDGWTAITVDNSRTAQWEETILITKDGSRVLTKISHNSIFV